MSTITSSGHLNAIVSTDVINIDNAMQEAANDFSREFFAIDLFSPLSDFTFITHTTTSIAGTDPSAAGSLSLVGTNLLGTTGDAHLGESGTITQASFAGTDHSHFSLSGGTLDWSAVSDGNPDDSGILNGGTFTTLDFSDSSGNEVSARGSFSLSVDNENFSLGLSGTVTQETIHTASGLTVTLNGDFSVTNGGLALENGTGTLDSISVHDAARDSINVTGDINYSDFSTAVLDSITINDLLNSPAVLSGDDVLTVADASRTWHGGDGSDTITGGSLADTLAGDAGADTLIGLAGNDFLDGGTGADTMIGGLGNDTYVVDNAGDVVIEIAGQGTDLVLVSISYALPANIENLTLTGSADLTATGNSLANVLTGNSGNDTLDGGAGNDTIVSGTGIDTMIGGAGSDTYIVNNSNDVIIESTVGSAGGVDLVSSNVSYTLPDNVEKLSLTGTDDINGTGNALNNVIAGNSGNNTLDGGAGVDTLQGGLGNDTYIVDVIVASGVAKLQDVVTDIGGDDTIVLRAGDISAQITHAATFTLATGIENLDASLTSANDAFNLTGNTANNILTANNHGDTLNGLTGVDTLIGGTGNDTFVVDNSLDVVHGNGGTDTVMSSVTYSLAPFSDVNVLTLTGTTAINGTANDNGDTLTGNGGTNTLTGGAGNDRLIGGPGHDVLTGGAGADTFVFHHTDAASAANSDTITDFTPGGGGDVIDISDILAGHYVNGVSVLDNFVHLTADGRGNSILSVNAMGGGPTFFPIATLAGVTGHTPDDLLATGNLVV